jgi:membrane-associated phospholipid phosphatase
MRHYRFIDYLTQGYILLVALILVAFQGRNVQGWGWFLVAHAVALVGVHLLIQAGARWPGHRLLGFFRCYYPILCYTGFYRECGYFNQMLVQGYLDAGFLRLELGLFGWQPGIELMERLPQRWLAEALYFAYFSYYLMIGGVGLALFLRNRRQFDHFLAVVSCVFYVCYLTYIFTPVVGPRILTRDVVPNPPLAAAGYDAPPTVPASVEAAAFYQLMLFIYDNFETPGAAFPSSHVAIALTTLYFSFLYLPRIRWLHLGLTLLLMTATVYGRYHYVVDVPAGMLTAALLIPLANWLYYRFTPLQPDEAPAAKPG